ncbi:potassium channel family protein [Cognatilysobacter segetis]|uniref:potassium channel family protein n=1 Tax=Cognatilysobacter segetis TaxID=2492394 RepID=UPI00105DA675|nr:potassium channel family protein [Lysobacter segetis]
MGAPLLVHGIAIATAAVAVVAVVYLTFEGMVALGRAYNRHRRDAGGPVGRWKVLRLVLGLIALHTVSILVFGSAYWFLLHVPGAGTIEGASQRASLFDAFYLSAMTYSTVGFGDLSPRGPIRWVAGTEALIGLMMVAWSASFAFVEMSRHWRDDLR